MEQKGNIGLIVEIKEDGIGFNYGVFDFYDNKIYHHHISTIIPLTVKWDFKLNSNLLCRRIYPTWTKKELKLGMSMMPVG